MVSGDELARIGLKDLHYRWRELLDMIFMGDNLLLCNHGKPIALIKPLQEKARVPKDALVRNISYVHRHRREFAFELIDGNRIIFVYKGKKVAVVDPNLPARLKHG